MTYGMQIIILVVGVFWVNCEDTTLVHGEFPGFGNYEENLSRPVGEGLTISSNGESVVFNPIQRPPKKEIGNGLTIGADGELVTGSFGGFQPQQHNEFYRQKRQAGLRQQGSLLRQFAFGPQNGFNFQRRQNNFDRTGLFGQQGGFNQQNGFGQQGGFNRENGFGQQGGFNQQNGFNLQTGLNRQNGFGFQNELNRQNAFGFQNGLNQQNGLNFQTELNRQNGFGLPSELNRQNGFGQQGGFTFQGDQDRLNLQTGLNRQDNLQNGLDLEADRIRRQTDSNTITTTTVAPPTTASPAFLNCLQNCPTTNQYNPVCGTDSLNYHNAQKLTCAQNCGKSVQQLRLGTCQPL